MIKRFRSLEPPIQYDDNDGADVCGSGAVLYHSNILFTNLVNFRKTFKILPQYGLVAAVREDRAHMPLRGYFTIYQEQPKAGLRFLVQFLFIEIMDYWENEIGQIMPN